MSTRPRSFAALAVGILALGGALLPALPAAADPAVCATIGGTWDAGTTTCTVTGAGAVDTTGGNVQLVGDLVVSGTGSLAVAGVWNFRVSGTTTVAGTLSLNAGGMEAQGGATVTGNGQLTINTASFAGGITVNGPGAVASGGTAGNVVVLDGTFNVTSTTTGTITNSDIVNSSSSITGVITNLAGTFTSTGTINNAVIVNGGTFAIQSFALGAVTVNGGTLTNTGFGNISGTTTVAAGATFTNSATAGAVSNAGTFTNTAAGASGAVTNTGTGSLVNDGAITGGVTHSSTGTFTGSGTTTPAYPQTVAFSSAAPVAPAAGDTYAVTLTSSAVGTTPTLTAGPAGVCSVAGTTVTFLADGACTVTVDRAATGNFASASASQTIAVGAVPGGGAVLPATGGTTGPELLVGLGLVLVGGGILLMRRLQAVRS